MRHQVSIRDLDGYDFETCLFQSTKDKKKT